MSKIIAAKTIAILGAGSWGSAIAVHLARNGNNIRLWGHDPKRLQQLTQARVNQTYLPDVIFPENIVMEADLAECVKDAAIIFVAVPSHAFSALLTNLKPLLIKDAIVSWGTKGLFHGKFLHEVAFGILGKAHPLAVISGPSFALEVAKHLPTAVTVASKHQSSAELLIECFRSETFRTYISSDIQGVEIGGVVKNVLAIAVGISDGLGFGANARAALITRGLAEMKALGKQLGAKEDTFNGLAGIGDLILTATDNQSRNRRFGLALGEGISISAAQEKIGQVVEGARNAREIHELAKTSGIDMPICEQVYQVIYQSVMPTEAVRNLLDRDLRPE